MRLFFALLLVAWFAGVAHAKHRRVVTATSITVFGPIKFIGASAVIDQRAAKDMLDAVASAFAGNTDLRLIEVFAYGADAPHGRQQVAEERARRIAAELVARGVEARRLIPRGYALPPPGASGDPGFVILRRSGDRACGPLTCIH